MDPRAPQPSPRPLNRRDGLVLLGLWLACLALDLLWIHQHQAPPSWDQGDHLSRALGIWQVLRSPQPWSGPWWQQLWAQAPSYRGPLSYAVAAPVLELLGPGYRSAMAANGLFNGLLLLSCYGLGRQLHSRSAGLWSALVVAAAPALLNQRTDYLIDLSLTAVLTGSWWLLSQRRWWGGAHPWRGALLAGAGLAAVFLTRPTGLVLLWLPLLGLLLAALGAARTGRWGPLQQLVAATALAGALCWPWFSQNWLTILSTINNARQWGVQYQEGLEATSLEGWLYYPRLLPTMAGAGLVALVLAGAAVAAMAAARRGSRLRPGPHPRGWWLWWLSFPAGGLLVCVLMSTKDFRFVLPLLPQLAVALGVLVARVQQPWAPLWKGALVLVALQGALWNQFGWGVDLSGFPPHRPSTQGGWPLEAIVATIRRTSPHQLSTLAVLPDSEQLNAFNLEAEGRSQGFRVAARQTVGRLEQAAGNLERFDWFLLKGGDQGVMSDERQARQAGLVRASGAFQRVGQWGLPDGSRAELYRRQPLSVAVDPLASCPRGGLQAALQPLPGGLELTLQGPTRTLQGSRLLLDLRSATAVLRADQAIGQGQLRSDGLPRNGCITVHQRLALKEAQPEGGPYAATLQLLTSSGQQRDVTLARAGQPLQWPDAPTDPQALAENRVLAAEAMGQQLRRGQFDPLFDQIGLLNQSDPDQAYLADAETVLRARLQRDPGNLNDLYALAVCQALQRQAGDAALSLQQLHRLDPGNPSPLIGLGVVELYRFRPWAAQAALDQAARITAPDAPIAATLRTLRIAASALRLDLRQALSLLQP
jgi:4-amino-4-deoxy-L-arabinose transferase-like glycosyltransferase